MESNTLKRELPLVLLLLIPFIYGAAIYNQLPAIIPTHFGLDGQPNGWMGRWAIFLIPATNIPIYPLLYFIRRIDPKKMSDEVFGGLFYKIRVTISVFFFIIALVCINAMQIGHMPFGNKLMMLLIFGLFTVLGNFMINIKPNWFVGIRTPWTLSNETVWKKTHQLGGRVWFYGGLLCMIATLLLPSVDSIVLLMAFLGISSVYLTGYSYWEFRKEEKANG